MPGSNLMTSLNGRYLPSKFFMAAGSSQKLVRRLVQPRKLRPLSRWPGHWPASEKMQVNVEDRLSGVGPRVDNRAVTGLVDLLFLGDAPSYERKMRSEERR